eukprot:c16837_g1_i1.p1 GENE.c16837_g1_i1~~c16837_g1_i1.p1  ORF type:complete len:256 (-),score=44.62 c16837_g1_i1:97-864(-)
MFFALQSTLLRPELSVSVINKDSCFNVHVSRQCLKATASFTISTVADFDKQLELGSLLGEVVLDLHAKRLVSSVQLPRLQFVSEDQWVKTAKVLAAYSAQHPNNNNRSSATLTGVGLPELVSLDKIRTQLTSTMTSASDAFTAALGTLSSLPTILPSPSRAPPPKLYNVENTASSETTAQHQAATTNDANEGNSTGGSKHETSDQNGQSGGGGGLLGWLASATNSTMASVAGTGSEERSWFSFSSKPAAPQLYRK